MRNREAYLAYQRKYYRRNLAALKHKRRAFYAANRERIVARQVEYNRQRRARLRRKTRQARLSRNPRRRMSLASRRVRR